ncbi:MAG TPA: hypothetical protein VGJ66_19565 [Pyrinomonadaceae bacterium]|jgi:hypothetical protein
MKPFKAICAATVIALSLSIPAYAEDNPPPPPGDVHIPGLPSPTSGGVDDPTTTPVDSPSVDGDVSFSALADMLWAMASIF